MSFINGVSEFSINKISLFLCTRSGATSIEYALIAAGIAIGLFALARALGIDLIGKLAQIYLQLN
jgi:Flp pilus assembly pilin Flp